MTSIRNLKQNIGAERRPASRVAIYARVSTEDQTTENQIAPLENFCKARNWQIVKVYAENASAWRLGHQLQLSQLLKDARVRSFDILLVWALDRLTRAGILAQFQLLDKLTGYGVQVISLQEPWTEVTNETRPLLLSIYAHIAKSESDRRSERTKAGMERAKAKGQHVGRPKGSKDTVKRKRVGYLLRFASDELREKYGAEVPG